MYLKLQFIHTRSSWRRSSYRRILQPSKRTSTSKHEFFTVSYFCGSFLPTLLDPDSDLADQNPSGSGSPYSASDLLFSPCSGTWCTACEQQHTWAWNPPSVSATASNSCKYNFSLWLLFLFAEWEVVLYKKCRFPQHWQPGSPKEAFLK